MKYLKLFEKNTKYKFDKGDYVKVLPDGSWDGILIIPPDYYNFLNTIKRYNV